MIMNENKNFIDIGIGTEGINEIFIVNFNITQIINSCDFYDEFRIVSLLKNTEIFFNFHRF